MEKAIVVDGTRHRGKHSSSGKKRGFVAPFRVGKRVGLRNEGLADPKLVAVFYLQTTIFQARPAGFEPATGGLEVRCSVP
jgi:hypothetical protein